jgi:hypothetical protein
MIFKDLGGNQEPSFLTYETHFIYFWHDETPMWLILICTETYDF